MIICKELQEKQKEDYKYHLMLIHKLAVWTRCEPKKFPKLQDIYNEIDDKVDKSQNKGNQSAKRMLDVVKQLNARFGGTGGA